MRIFLSALAALAFSVSAQAAPLDPALTREIDAIAEETLRTSGVPSASIAIVRDGEIAYAEAYGVARSRTRATTGTRYAIGSISKQFTAACILMLAEDGKLTLDDKIDPYVPTLTRGRDITIRQILSHTSGYRDYWPQDFVPGLMQRPTSAQATLTRWARIPLDYEPGAEYRYSNTGFTIAGLIVEKVAGAPLHQVQQQRIFNRLGMTSATEIDSGPLGGADDSQGHARWGLSTPQPAVKEGRGWLYAIGELAMTPSDLARWNISLMRGTLLKPASLAAMTTSVMLTNGNPANYGAGLDVRTINGKRVWSHGGAVSGYLANNVIYADENLAVTVLTNGEFGGVQDALTARLAFLLRAQPPKVIAARDMLAQFQRGQIDRTRFTANGNGYYTDAVVQDLARTLRPLGSARLIQLQTDRLRGGLTVEVYAVTFADRRVTIVARADPATGKYEQFVVDFGV